MADLITGVLTAYSQMRTNDTSWVTQDIDFSVRAPIGIVINRVTSQLSLNDVGGIASSEQEASFGISLNDEVTSISEAPLTALSDEITVNSDMLFVHIHQFDGDNTSGLAAAGNPNAGILDLEWGFRDIVDRPVTFNPLRHLGVVAVATEYVNVVRIEYQLARFTTDELASFAAGRI